MFSERLDYREIRACLIFAPKLFSRKRDRDKMLDGRAPFRLVVFKKVLRYKIYGTCKTLRTFCGKILYPFVLGRSKQGEMEVERHYFTTAGKKFRRAKCGENLSKLVPRRNARFSCSMGKEKSTERTSFQRVSDRFLGFQDIVSRNLFREPNVLKLHE